MPAEQAPLASGEGYRALLRNHRYRTLLGSEVALLVGHGLFITILPWLMLDVTGSDSAVGWATTARFLPYLLLAVPAGALVDRVDRRRSMMTVCLLGAALALLVPILHASRTLAGGHALLIASLLSALVMLFQLARSSIIPEIVPRQELVTANAANIIVAGLAVIAGNALVGPVVRTIGLANGFAVYAGALALSAVLLSPLALVSAAERGVQRQRVQWGDLLEGLSFVWHDGVIRRLFLLDALYFVLASGMLMTGIPLFVKDVLHAGPEVYGYTQIAGNAGMLVGALWLGQYGHHLPKGRVIVSAWLGYGLALMAYPVFGTLPAALAASFVASVIGNLIPASERSLLQERVPEGLVGRVFGVWGIIAPGAGTFSGVIGGALADVLPSGLLIALGAAVACANGLIGRVTGLWEDSATSGGPR